MEGKKNITPIIGKIAFCVLVVLSFVATFTKIFTGFDIDEAYALAMPYRVLQGDRLFKDMWEVHQTSAFIPFLFIKVWDSLTHSMDHLVVYMRLAATIVHFGITVFVYACCAKVLNLKEDVFCSFGKVKIYLIPAVSALIFYNFMPKWMMNFDFSLMQLWFTTLFIGFSLIAQKERNHWIWLVAGFMLAIDVLIYPGMLLLYPTMLILMVVTNKKEALKPAIFMTLGCAVSAIIFFACVLSNMSVGEFVASIPKVFMDGAHQYDLTTKLMLYAKQWAEVLIQTLIVFIPALLASFVANWLYKKLSFQERFGRISFDLLVCLVFEIEVAFLITFAGLLITWGPFRLQVRYIIHLVLAYILMVIWKKKKEASTIWWLCLLSFVGVLVASNVGPTTSASYLVLANMLFVAITLLVAKDQGVFAKWLSYVGMFLFITSLIMCKGYYMRNTEYVPGDISDGLVQIEEGPLCGVYVRASDYERYSADYDTIVANTSQDDLVLFMGTESLCNLYANGKIVSPTTISTPAFNEQWVEYFEMYPQKCPTVIFLAKNTVDNRVKFFSKNPFGIWIAQHYDVECMEETDSLCIIR